MNVNANESSFVIEYFYILVLYSVFHFTYLKDQNTSLLWIKMYKDKIDNNF